MEIKGECIGNEGRTGERGPDTHEGNWTAVEEEGASVMRRRRDRAAEGTAPEKA